MRNRKHFPSREPPGEAAVLWVEMPDDAVHIVDGVFAAEDGLVNVRREYAFWEGRKLFKLYAAPGAVSEVCRLLREMRRYVPVGEIRVEP